MKTILITGATGFIGQHLVQANLDAGHKVEAFVRPKSPGIRDLCLKGVDIILGDITNFMAVEHAVNGVDIVYHLAGHVSDWENLKRFQAVHVDGMKNICLACQKRQVELLVNVSTSDVFGLNEKNVITESHPYQFWQHPYPDTKIEAATIARDYSQKGLPVTTVYPCRVYGPGDKVFFPWLVETLQQKKLQFWRKKPLLWPTYVGNLVDFLMTVASHPAAKGQDFIMHDGVSDTFEHFAAQVAQALSLAPPTLHIPYFAALTLARLMEKTWKFMEKPTRPPLTAYMVKKLGSRLNFSTQKAENLLGWKPPIPFETALARTLNIIKTDEKKNGS